MARYYVYFDMTIGGAPAGRIEMTLRADVADSGLGGSGAALFQEVAKGGRAFVTLTDLRSFARKHFAGSSADKLAEALSDGDAALLSAAMFGHALRANFVVGGAIVLISMHMFYAKPDALLAGKGEGVGSRKGGLTVSPSMEHFGGVPSRTQSSSSFDSSGSAEGHARELRR